MGNIREILSHLPGGDCSGRGGCGFTSCQQCAEAMEKAGDTKATTLCPAASQAQVDAIAKALGCEAGVAKDEVAFIRCSGEAAGKARFAAMGCKSCEEARKSGFLEGECSYGCMGIGSCIEACKFNAMKLEDGRIVIDREKCNGCGACLSLCPNTIITLVPREATNFIPCASQNNEEKTRALCGHGCIGCKECEEACPEGAVKVINNCAVIDYSKCVGCVACTVKCKKKIIVDTLHDLTKVKESVAFVRCTGGKKAKEKFDALGVENCKDASKIRTREMGLCTYGCVGFGECTKVCRYDAIHVVDGTAVVDPDKCVGCLDCTFACPNHLIVEVPFKGAKAVACASEAPRAEREKVCDTGCIGCGDCAANCPNGAISVQGGHAVVDTSICEDCGVCTYMCSRSVLRAMEVDESNYLQHQALGR